MLVVMIFGREVIMGCYGMFMSRYFVMLVHSAIVIVIVVMYCLLLLLYS
jgi:hypothetical protein